MLSCMSSTLFPKSFFLTNKCVEEEELENLMKFLVFRNVLTMLIPSQSPFSFFSATEKFWVQKNMGTACQQKLCCCRGIWAIWDIPREMTEKCIRNLTSWLSLNDSLWPIKQNEWEITKERKKSLGMPPTKWLIFRGDSPAQIVCSWWLFLLLLEKWINGIAINDTAELFIGDCPGDFLSLDDYWGRGVYNEQNILSTKNYSLFKKKKLFLLLSMAINYYMSSSHSWPKWKAFWGIFWFVGENLIFLKSVIITGV